MLLAEILRSLPTCELVLLACASLAWMRLIDVREQIDRLDDNDRLERKAAPRDGGER